MAALKFGGQYALTAAAVNLATAFSLTDLDSAQCTRITVKNSASSVNNLYIGGSDVTNAPLNAHIELVPGQSYDFYSSAGFLAHPSHIYLVGTVNAANKAFINGMA